MRSKLSLEDIKRYYIKENRSDRSIAKEYGVHPMTIRLFRDRNQIKTRDTGYNEIIVHVIRQLEDLGHQVENYYAKNKLSSFYLLIDGKIRVDVKRSSITKENTFVFTLTDPIRNEMIESDIRIKLPNGRFKKLYHKTCDYIIFCGVHEGEKDHWIIPTKDLPDTLQSLTVSKRYGDSKYNKYRENWKLL